MRSIAKTPWPPSLDALEPIVEIPRLPREPRANPDPVLVNLRQHRELTSLLSDLAKVIDGSEPARLDPDGKEAFLHRLQVSLRKLNRFMAPHRDTEESVVFPYLLAEHPELAGDLDSLGDDHVRIFAESRDAGILMDRFDEGALQDIDRRAELLSTLRTFVEHVWRHTLVEERMIRGVRAT